MGQQLNIPGTADETIEVLVCSGALFGAALGRLFAVQDADAVRVTRSRNDGVDVYVNGERVGALLPEEYTELLEAQALLPEEAHAQLPGLTSARAQAFEDEAQVRAMARAMVAAAVEQASDEASDSIDAERERELSDDEAAAEVAAAGWSQAAADAGVLSQMDRRQARNATVVMRTYLDLLDRPESDGMRFEQIARAALVLEAAPASIHTEKRYRTAMRKYLTLNGHPAMVIQSVCAVIGRDEITATFEKFSAKFSDELERFSKGKL